MKKNRCGIPRRFFFGIMGAMDTFGEYSFKVRSYECDGEGFATLPKDRCVSVDLTIEKRANGEYVCTGRNPETMHEVKSSERGSMSAAISSFAHECGIQTELVKDR